MKQYLQTIGENISEMDYEKITTEIERMIFEDMRSTELTSVITLAIKSFIEKIPHILILQPEQF